MKSIGSVIIALVLLCAGCAAYAGETWACPACGHWNSGNFCVECGARRPAVYDGDGYPADMYAAEGVYAADPDLVWELTGIGGEYLLDLTVEFEENLLFSTYDVHLYLDDAYIATLPHGMDYHGYLGVPEGRHILSFYQSGDDTVNGISQFYVVGDTAYECEIEAKSNKIKVSDEEKGIPFTSVDSMSAEKYVAGCTVPVYTEDPEKYEERRIAVTGTVRQVIEGWYDMVTLLLEDDAGGIWYAVYPTSADSGLDVGRQVTVCGEGTGTTSYFTLSGDIASLPSLEAVYILLR